MTSLQKRIVTGVLLVAVIITCVLSGEIGFFLLISGINELALMEYVKLVQQDRFSLQKSLLRITGFLFILMAWLTARQVLQLSVLTLLPVLAPVIFSIELFRKKKNPVQNMALSLAGLVWISLSLGLFLFTAFLPYPANEYHGLIAMGYFIILWLGDSGAFLSGKIIGRRKLFERISPKKTWEGWIGGLAFSWMAGLANFLLLHQMQLSQWLLLSLIIYITGTFGDFIKSMLKRSAGVKDSGTILPGHGGILDRFDTLIGSAPFAFLYFLYYVQA